MNNDNSVQVGAYTPAALKLEPSALMTELPNVISPGQVGYSSEKHMDLVNRLLAHLNGDDGKPAEINEKLQTIIKAVFRPTEDVQRDLLRQGFEDAGYVLTAETERTFLMMFSAPQFADFLAKKVNPKTGKPFIVKERKRGAKKGHFDALIDAPIEAPTADKLVPEVTAQPPEKDAEDGDAGEVEEQPTSVEAASEKPAVKSSAKK